MTRVGEIWTRIRPRGDGQDTFVVVRVTEDDNPYKINYVPRFVTVCTPLGYDNGYKECHFKGYELDETDCIKRILESYE